jgi:hypothetical protein
MIDCPPREKGKRIILITADSNLTQASCSLPRLGLAITVEHGAALAQPHDQAFIATFRINRRDQLLGLLFAVQGSACIADTGKRTTTGGSGP